MKRIDWLLAWFLCLGYGLVLLCGLVAGSMLGDTTQGRVEAPRPILVHITVNVQHVEEIGPTWEAMRSKGLLPGFYEGKH